MEPRRTIAVVAYRSEWPAIFDAEARHLRNTLASVLIDIHHIGSTSVPGLPCQADHRYSRCRPEFGRTRCS